MRRTFNISECSFDLIVDDFANFKFFLADDAMRVLVPEFKLLVVTSALDAGFVLDEERHFIVEGIGPG